MHLSAGRDEDPTDLPGVPAFGVPVLALSDALGDATGKEDHDLVISMIAHPWCVVLPVATEHARRAGDHGWEHPMSAWTTDLGSHATAHNVVCAIDHECPILTASPEDYTVDGNLLDGILIRIPGDDDGWPDAREYWTTD